MKNDRLLIGIALLSFTACATLESQSEFLAGRQALIRHDPTTAISYFERVALGDPKFVTKSTLLSQSIWTYVGRAQYESGKFVEAKESCEKALSYFSDDQMAKLYLGLSLLRLPAAVSATNALTVQEVSYALHEGIEPKRVAALARERGVAFDLTKETESQLRSAGADSLLVEEIKKIRAESAKQRPENQTARGAKELVSALTGLRDAFDYIIANTTQGKFWDPGGEIRAQIKTGLSLLSSREPDWQKVLSAGEWIGQQIEEETDRARRDEAEELRRRQAR
ncbi:MAG TPA: hypothetical protein VGA09_05080 [Candidatus Binatia bacterium]